jgi:hypothetical protein
MPHNIRMEESWKLFLLSICLNSNKCDNFEVQNCQMFIFLVQGPDRALTSPKNVPDQQHC